MSPTRAAADHSTDGESDQLGWLSHGAWAIAEQGMFAGGHFVFHLLLARWLPPAEYGWFAMVYAGLMLLVAVHHAAFADPILVLGAGRFRAEETSYLATILRAHAVVWAALAGALGVAALVAALAGHTPAATSLAALGVSAGAVLLPTLLRRICYLHRRFRLATLGALAYVLTLVLGAVAIRAFGLGAASALMAMGAAGIAVSAILFAVLDLSLRGAASQRAVLQAHWVYARWALPTHAAAWTTVNIWYWLLPAWSTVAAAAELRVLMTVLLPILHANIALGNMLQPRLAGARDRAAAWRMAARALLLLLSLAGGAMVLAWLFGAEVIGAINADYVPHAGLLPLLAIYPLLAGIATVLQSMLRARERYAPVLLAHALSACTALAVGVPLAAAHGMLGAVIGIVSGYSVAVVVQGVRLR